MTHAASSRPLFALLLAAAALATPQAAAAQALGTFRWQQQPYCNVITVNVV